MKPSEPDNCYVSLAANILYCNRIKEQYLPNGYVSSFEMNT